MVFIVKMVISPLLGFRSKIVHPCCSSKSNGALGNRYISGPDLKIINKVIIKLPISA